MKRNLLAIAIPALLVAGAANASIEVINKDGNKLDVYGRVYALNYIGDHRNDVDHEGDKTTARVGFNGVTQVTDSLAGYGRFEYETGTGVGSFHETRYAFAGLDFGNYGQFDYGRNDGVVKAITAYTDVLPEFGGDAKSYALLGDRSSAVATYRNSNFYGLVDGLSFAVQYADSLGTTGKSTGRLGDVNEAMQKNEAYGTNVQYDILDTGVSVGAGYAKSVGDHDARTWMAGVKYDAYNLYLGAIYLDTKIDKDIGIFKTRGKDEKIKGFELVAQYHFDFEVGRLTPSLAYIQHQEANKNVAHGDKKYLAKYVEVGATYDFNKNLTAVVDYKINLLDKKDLGAEGSKYNTKDTLALGLIYQF